MHKKYSKLIFAYASILIFLVTLMIAVIGTPKIDHLISQKVVSITEDARFDEFFIFLGHYLQQILIGIAIVMIFILYLQKRKETSLILFLGLVFGFILEQIIKFSIQRERPLLQLIQETSYSFPSGHSIFAIILFSFLIYFYKEKIKNKIFRIIFILVNIFLILLSGFSRIYLNIHWFTDILGGFALGFAIVNVVLFFILKGK